MRVISPRGSEGQYERINVLQNSAKLVVLSFHNFPMKAMQKLWISATLKNISQLLES